MWQASRPAGSAWSAGLAAIALAILTLACSAWFGVANSTVPALSYLLVVLLAAAYSQLWVALAASIASVLLLNYFFLPPRGTFNIADPENWVALLVLLAVSLVGSQLSASAKARALDATARRDELAKLFDLSRDVLRTTDSESAHAQLAYAIGQRFDLPYVAVCLPKNPGWSIHEAGRAAAAVSSGLLEAVFRDAGASAQPDHQDPRHAAHHTVDRFAGPGVHVVPLRVAGRPVGLLATAGRHVDPATLDAVAGVAAIAVERVHLLEEWRNAQLARKSAELKSTLLDSLAHDLRTPLTAIRVAAGNLQADWATNTERQAQSDIVLAEVARLNRLFQNILDMARIETEAVSVEREWVTPDDVVEAALAQAQPSLGTHRLSVQAEADACVRIDPRLTSSALAHLVENAAQYSPPGTVITIDASARDEGLHVAVEDEGPGIAPADLPRLFDRSFRGRAAAGRPTGAGMGLAISRGLLAAQGGTVTAENREAGGARFTVVIRSDVRRAVVEP